MWRGKMRLEWDTTSALWLLHAAVNTPKGKRPKTVHDIHPLYQQSSRRAARTATAGEGVAVGSSMKAALKAMANQKQVRT